MFSWLFSAIKFVGKLFVETIIGSTFEAVIFGI